MSITEQHTEDATDADVKESGASHFDSFTSGKYAHLWRNAVEKLRSIELDPWVDFPLQSIPTIVALRHRYSAIKKKWFVDEISVKLETSPFDRGAMRECFRMKKVMKSGVDKGEASNYVAKRYMSNVNRQVYFDDVRLQMEAKLWAEAFNRQNPPKKVDIFQLSVLELKGPADSEDKSSAELTTGLYHIERFMNGEYRKYNSNSGFVDEQLRNTPQAFSHFTFERSGHRLLVVDIQGVGDLYTDPQIHTADGVGYSDANLGPRGMAYFFHSHRCNPLCEWLGLAPFDLAPSELGPEEQQLQQQQSQAAKFPHPPPRSSGISLSQQSSPEWLESGFSDLSMEERGQQTGGFVRHRSVSFSQSPAGRFGPTMVRGDPALPGRRRCVSSNGDEFPRNRVLSGDSGCQQDASSRGSVHSLAEEEDPPASAAVMLNWFGLRGVRRVRNLSESSDIDAEEGHRLAGSLLHQLMHETHKPSCADHPTNLDQEIGQSILGQIHHELARLHEAGRFQPESKGGWSCGLHLRADDDDDYHDDAESVFEQPQVDWAAVLFHEKHAAQLGCLEAMIVMAHHYLGLPTQLLLGCPTELTEANLVSGVDYLWRSALGGDRRCMIRLAHYLDVSASLQQPSSDLPNNLLLLLPSLQAFEPSRLPAVTADAWLEAVGWYQRAVDCAKPCDGNTPDEGLDAEGCYDAAEDLLPVYRILARIAEMYATGGHGLQRDYNKAGDYFNQAGESASAARQGRLAAQYFELAEEIYAKLEQT